MFREVLQIDPLNDAALFELGKIYFEYGKLDDARELLRLAAEQDPANTYYLETYGSALLYLAQYREAIEIYQQLLHIRPDDMDAAFSSPFPLNVQVVLKRVCLSSGRWNNSLVRMKVF